MEADKCKEHFEDLLNAYNEGVPRNRIIVHDDQVMEPPTLDEVLRRPLRS